MPIAELHTNSEAISGTEWSLVNDAPYTSASPSTADGIFQIFIDLANMGVGDQVQVRVYEKVTSGGTQRVVYQATFTGAQSEPIFVSPSLILMHGWDVTLDAVGTTSPTVITITWSIRQVAEAV